MNAEGKFLIDVGLIALIIVIWVRWQRNAQAALVRRAEPLRRRDLNATPQKELFSCLNENRNSPQFALEMQTPT
jgi:hypothetical protein